MGWIIITLAAIMFFMIMCSLPLWAFNRDTEKKEDLLKIDDKLEKGIEFSDF